MKLANTQFSDFLSGSRCAMVSRAAPATHRRMSERVPWLPDAAEEIYVARTDTEVRPMMNEPELIELLRSQGVSTVVPGELSISLQIATFCDACGDGDKRHSAASASSVSSSVAIMAFATTPDCSRILCSIASATSR